MTAHVRYVLALADDALVASQRLGGWIARAPELEEDVALANIGLDLLGQARALLSHAGRLEGEGRDEDTLAYFRDERDFLNVQLVERDNGDFAVTMARLLFLATYQHELWSALCRSADDTLAAVAAKAVKEAAYHVDHARMWVLRLGDGTEESHQRMQAGLDAEWPYVEELFDAGHVAAALVEEGVAVDPATIRGPWLDRVSAVVDEATLTLPDVRPAVTGGRRGIHTEQMGLLLAEMQHLARSHPGASW
ncbi:MAG TPA: 1,2-phenylacetyl-CoA epoxidase subunit PaaC [Nocardioidaceae bacterium]